MVTRQKDFEVLKIKERIDKNNKKADKVAV